MKIETLLSCSGCNACNSICPKSAITMETNYEGFLYPVIDSKNCIKCGLCEKVCPSLDPINKNVENTTAFAVINKNEIIRSDSSSGGVFTALAEEIINNKGIVFGAKFADDFSVIHSWTDNLEGLADFRGSKYLQSIIGNAYKECKNFLESGNKVLFTGTPCQIQGLLKYLNKEYDNLITVDFICHGVPSPLLWTKYIKFREKKSASRTLKTAFRRKNDGWKLYSVLFTFANNTEYRASLKKDPYMQMFLKDIALRESCYQCSCRGIERPSDITIADFWGIQNIFPELDDDKGISLVLFHSHNGKELLNTVLKECVSKEVQMDLCIKYNPAIINSPKRPKQRDSFYLDLAKKNINKIIYKYVVTPVWLRSYRFIRRIYNKLKIILNGS